MKTYRCALCDREFELSDDAVPDKWDGKTAFKRCILELE
jgi:DNA-directed RNA polymerase subunit RPC12/RpoP